MHLMGAAIETLRVKGVEITKEEALGARLAILLHDIGHGPFSHALENCIVTDLTHEDLSELFLERLNAQYDGRLSTAIAIFQE
jgi:HD superfamily phosphohydrolase